MNSVWEFVKICGEQLIKWKLVTVLCDRPSLELFFWPTDFCDDSTRFFSYFYYPSRTAGAGKPKDFIEVFAYRIFPGSEIFFCLSSLTMEVHVPTNGNIPKIVVIHSYIFFDV